MSHAVLSVLLFALGAGPSQLGAADLRPLELQLREIRLELEAALDFELGTIRGSLKLTVENVSDDPTAHVPLLLNRLMVLDRAAGLSGLEIEFQQDVVTFADWPERQVNFAILHLSDPVAPGKRFSFEVEYSGFLVGYTETGMLYVQDRIDQEFSILRAEAFAFPVVGYPNSDANSAAPRRDFDYRIALSVPEALTVASGGELIEKTVRDGIATWIYESRGPAPFLNIPIARYQTLADQGVTVFHFPEDAEGARLVLSKTLAALDLLAQWFGPLGSPAHFSIMEIPEGWGSQASLTGGIIQTADAFREPGRLTALYHEISHLWNAPDRERPSARWNEGLATFLQFKLAERLDGRGDRHEAVERSATRLLERIAAETSYQNVPFSRYGDEDIAGLSYRTGLVMFHLLHELVGEEIFNRILGGHYQTHRTTTGSFEDLLERAGKLATSDLQTFFNDWVYTTDWQEKLRSSESVAALLDSYRR